MGNCLVTKLKETVDNSNLLKLGELKIHRNKYTTNYQSYNRLFVEQINGGSLHTYIGGTNSVHCDQDATFNAPLRDFSGSRNGYVLSQTSEKPIDISIMDKYSLCVLRIGIDMYLDCNELAYSPMRIIDLASGDDNHNIYRGNANPLNSGNLSEMLRSSKNSIQVIQVANTLVEGTVMDLVECPNLDIINFAGSTTITGDWIPFVNANRAAGITTGRIRTVNSFPFTLNGKEATAWSENFEQQSMNWDETHIYVKVSNSQIHVYKVFCYGYTDGEIASLTQPGGDWEGHTVTKCD